MWSLTSLRTKRMSSFRKFRLLPPKDFFDSIGQNWKSSTEQMFSELPLKADIARCGRHVSKVPILLQKSFWCGERKILEPLMRSTRGDVGDHIVSSKIDHGRA